MFSTACIHPPIKSKPRIKYKGFSVVHILAQTAHKHFLEQKSTSSSQETQNAIQWNTAFCRKHHVFKRFEGGCFQICNQKPLWSNSTSPNSYEIIGAEHAHPCQQCVQTILGPMNRNPRFTWCIQTQANCCEMAVVEQPRDGTTRAHLFRRTLPSYIV